ncbi:MAG TPA: FAD-dependent oxidoreductase, partial [Polyangiaceae bacterium]
MNRIVVYGATSAGIAAAVQVARMGCAVVLIEPTARLGGLTTGGLGATDIGNKAAIGGLAREFYCRVRKHYRQPAAWRWQRPDEYQSRGQATTDPDEEAQWTFEPSAALAIFRELLREHGIAVEYDEPLDRRPGAGVRREGRRIAALVGTSGREYRGQVFIDATYEGDLMAASGVSYRVGREGEAEYSETLAGARRDLD